MKEKSATERETQWNGSTTPYFAQRSDSLR